MMHEYCTKLQKEKVLQHGEISHQTANLFRVAYLDTLQNCINWEKIQS